ncbi:hypothetical protein [Glacieibacterium frigidum]|uniref:hypothetical protein n=1 Tax=Glacieibacterium frigidum TaxID=2593303 RepID=UPI00163D9F31|nr:hypothetical protein [Glacieibacterium frigidum]
MDLQAPQHAELHARWGKARVRMTVDVTPAGLLAIGGLVSSILLSTAVIVRVATQRRR